MALLVRGVPSDARRKCGVRLVLIVGFVVARLDGKSVSENRTRFDLRARDGVAVWFESDCDCLTGERTSLLLLLRLVEGVVAVADDMSISFLRLLHSRSLSRRESVR